MITGTKIVLTYVWANKYYYFNIVWESVVRDGLSCMLGYDSEECMQRDTDFLWKDLPKKVNPLLISI